MNAPCTCGNPRPHVIAERQTFDGKHVNLWSDGDVTQRAGYAFPGVPIARGRTAESARLALAAGWLMLGEVEVHDADEVPALYACARRVAARGGLPGDLRKAMADREVPRIPIRWEVLSADRDGRPTCRVGHLPRLMWAGVAVWHERGRYEIMRRHVGPALGARSHASWSGTGVAFTSQRELLRHLAANPPRVSERARGAS